jgi:hypothetical protein
MQTDGNKWLEETAALIGEVAVHMGAEWTVKVFDVEEYWNRLPELEHADGRRICLQKSRGSSSREAEKLYIDAGTWPKARTVAEGSTTISPYQIGEAAPGIHVSRNRGPEIIAREITRRFLPEYTRIWEKAKARAESEDSRVDATVATYRALCAGLGIEAKEQPNYRGAYEISLYGLPGGIYGDISISADTAELRIRSTPVALAVKVCETLRNWGKS